MQTRPFHLSTEFEPRGDQPQAIDILTRGVEEGRTHQTLLGVTGSGKTFTMAHVIERTGVPALILAHNKVLAAQLFAEFRDLFPDNAVEYFVSYYDYYQPEAYVPARDLYIEKDASINERIDKMRHSATRSLLTRSDVIVVASVSCIYGLGSPAEYANMSVRLTRGETVQRDRVLRDLALIQYRRNDWEMKRGTYRVRGDVLDIHPPYEDALVVRVEFFGDEVEAIRLVDPLRGEIQDELEDIAVFPGTHYVAPEDRMVRACNAIEAELEERLAEMRGSMKLLEAQRLEQRTRYDLEMLREVGFCSGIENYSRHIEGREAGSPPGTLLDFFNAHPEWLLFVDESHQTIPQVGAMYKGDRSRKETLVDHGFRLPSALDNRPLKFDEFEERISRMICVSATPADWEREKSGGVTAEQVIRPTGLVDPPIEVRPASPADGETGLGQVDDLVEEIRSVTENGFRTLVTTLTKRMAEDLTKYLRNLGMKVRYLHSDIDTLERSDLVRDLRLGVFDVLVGVNLLREGLDLPEVALVAVLDADKEGFLRSRTSLIQTCGRAARNVDGRVILYGDTVTESMEEALRETERRRAIQEAWNEEHGITPTTIRSRIKEVLSSIYESDYVDLAADAEEVHDAEEQWDLAAEDIPDAIAELTEDMNTAAEKLDFEEAARLRDRILELERLELEAR